MIKRLGCVAFLCVAIAANIGEAALTFRINGSTNPADINLMQSQTTVLTISLAGTAPETPFGSQFQQNQIELDQFGFRLETSSNIAIASAVFNPALVMTGSAITGNGSTIVSISGLINSANRPSLTNTFVNLATVTISTPGPGNTTIRIRDIDTLNNGNNQTTAGAGQGPFFRDPDLFTQAGGLSPTSVNLIIAVPEPSSMLLLAASGVALVGFGARRRFAAK